MPFFAFSVACGVQWATRAPVANGSQKIVPVSKVLSLTSNSHHIFLFSPRHLVKEGPIKVEQYRDGKRKDSKMYMFLFNNCLLLTKIKKRPERESWVWPVSCFCCARCSLTPENCTKS